jgi:hypothetical protein
MIIIPHAYAPGTVDLDLIKSMRFELVLRKRNQNKMDLLLSFHLGNYLSVEKRVDSAGSQSWGGGVWGKKPGTRCPPCHCYQDLHYPTYLK